MFGTQLVETIVGGALQGPSTTVSKLFRWHTSGRVVGRKLRDSDCVARLRLDGEHGLGEVGFGAVLDVDLTGGLDDVMHADG